MLFNKQEVTEIFETLLCVGAFVIFVYVMAAICSVLGVTR